MFKPVETAHAPAAVGPYSQGIALENLVFSSGQLPMNPETKTMPSDIAEQARQSLSNVKAVLEAAGSSMDQGGQGQYFPYRHGRLRKSQ